MAANKYLKLIWEFRGPEAGGTARHHEIHLREFLLAEKYPLMVCGVDEVNPSFFKAFIVIKADDMIAFRDRLRPQYGEWFDEAELSEEN